MCLKSVSLSSVQNCPLRKFVNGNPYTKYFYDQLYSRKIVSVGYQLYIINIWLIHNTKESILWNYKNISFFTKNETDDVP